jgi:hypothetical protein
VFAASAVRPSFPSFKTLDICGAGSWSCRYQHRSHGWDRRRLPFLSVDS